MKLFNIPNTNLFLKTLSECEGNVEVVSGGHRVPLVQSGKAGGGDLFQVFKEMYKGSHIRDIELFFSNENDVASMISLME